MSARICVHNYEAWLLDQLEGRLTAEQERELDAFLIAHPNLRPADDSMPKVGIDSAVLPDADRDALKRTLPPTGFVTEQTLNDHLIARHEGDLTPEQERALAGFLSAHPSAQRVDHQYALARIAPGGILLSEREALHRTLPPSGLPTLGDLDDFLVARLDGELSAEQERALSVLLAEHGFAQKEWATIQATRIAPETVVFTGKPQLKRSAKVIAIGAGARVWRLAAAASIALVLGLGWWWLRGERNADPGFAQRGASIPKAAQHQVSDGGQPNEREKPLVSDSIAQPHEASTPSQREPQERQVGESLPIPEPMEPLLPTPEPEETPMAQVPDQEPPTIEPHPHAEEPVALAQAPAIGLRDVERSVPTIGQTLTGVVRERMLALDAEPARPLDATDAEAAVDIALRTVAGDRAGLAVKRDAQGRRSGFDLRLGRHLALSARR
jgi:hypothetical protein